MIAPGIAGVNHQCSREYGVHFLSLCPVDEGNYIAALLGARSIYSKPGFTHIKQEKHVFEKSV